MFKSRDLPWLFLLAFCAAVAIGIAAFALGAQSLTGLQMAVAFVALAAGQLILFARLSYRHSKIERDMGQLALATEDALAEARQEHRLVADLGEQVSALRGENETFAQSMAQGMNQLHRSHATLAEYMKNALDHAQHSQAQHLQKAMEQERAWRAAQDSEQAQRLAEQTVSEPPETLAPAPPEPVTPIVSATTPPAFANALLVSLEPIIDVPSGQTAHYRLHFAMATDTGGEVNQDILSHHADRADLRPGLDLHLVREALTLLQRLRQRDPELGIMLPIGAATLSSSETLARIVDVRNAAGDAGKGLILDVAHVALASMSASGLEGLATLARQGVTLSLSNANVTGVDLASLDKLNVRFVCLSMPANLDQQQTQKLQGFSLAARALKVQVVMTAVATPAQTTSIARICRLASGAAYASPRRIKRETAQRNDYPAAAE